MPRPSPRTAVAASLIAALGIAGCGTQRKDSAKNFKGDQQQVAKVIESLEKAAVGRRTPDAKEICTKLITDALAKKIASQEQNKNCDERVKASMTDLHDAGGVATLEVKRVTIAGDTAVASVKAVSGNDDQLSNYTLEKSGNSWRISGF